MQIKVDISHNLLVQVANLQVFCISCNLIKQILQSNIYTLSKEIFIKLLGVRLHIYWEILIRKKYLIFDHRFRYLPIKKVTRNNLIFLSLKLN